MNVFFHVWLSTYVFSLRMNIYPCDKILICFWKGSTLFLTTWKTFFELAWAFVVQQPQLINNWLAFSFLFLLLWMWCHSMRSTTPFFLTWDCTLWNQLGEENQIVNNEWAWEHGCPPRCARISKKLEQKVILVLIWSKDWYSYISNPNSSHAPLNARHSIALSVVQSEK